MKALQFTLALLVVAATPAWAQWPVHEFAVVESEFDDEIDPNLVTGQKAVEGHDAMLREWNLIGARLESEKFKAPAMLPNRPRYGVYSAEWVLQSRYFPVCGGPVDGVIAPFFRSYIAPSYYSHPAAFTYFVFAHELMHAIQFGSPYAADCAAKRASPGVLDGWIVEGMANAVSLRLKEERYFGAVNTGIPSGTNIALRRYNIPLTLEEKQDKSEKSTPSDIPDEEKPKSTWLQEEVYHTSTFWDHLVRHYDGLPMLARLLDRRLDTKSDKYGIRWLHAALKQADKKLAEDGLYFVYPEFITEFGSFAGTYTRFDNKIFNPGDARKEWLNRVFGGCHEVVLDGAVGAGGQQAMIELDLDKIAAQCIHVKWQNMPPGAELMIEAGRTGFTKPHAEGLHLGFMIGRNSDTAVGSENEFACYKMFKRDPTRCLVKPFIKKSREIGYVKTWMTGTRIEEDGVSKSDGERYFSLSNVRPDEPWTTREISGLKMALAFCTAKASSGQKFGCPRASVMAAPSMQLLQAGSRNLLYGIADSGFMLPGMTGFELPVVGNDDMKYTFGSMPMQTGYGFTGAFRGMVGRETDSQAISSSACGNPEAPIGEILQSDENGLHVKISVDLCEYNIYNPQTCAQGRCPVVDHVDAEIFLPFGWRYFGETAGVDEVTPGMERYIERFVGAVAERSPVPLPGFGSSGTGSGTGGSDGSGESGSGQGGQVSPGVSDTSSDTGCDCSCEAIAAREAECAAIDDSNIGELMQCLSCVMPCVSEQLMCEGG